MDLCNEWCLLDITCINFCQICWYLLRFIGTINCYHFYTIFTDLDLALGATRSAHSKTQTCLVFHIAQNDSIMWDPSSMIPHGTAKFCIYNLWSFAFSSRVIGLNCHIRWFHRSLGGAFIRSKWQSVFMGNCLRCRRDPGNRQLLESSLYRWWRYLSGGRKE